MVHSCCLPSSDKARHVPPVAERDARLRSASRALTWNQCREFASGSCRRVSVRSAPHDKPSKRQKVTTLVLPHCSQTRFSSPSMKRPRLNAREEAGRRQCGQTREKFRAPQRRTRCLSQFTSSSLRGLCCLHASAEHSRGARKSGKVWDTCIRFEWPRYRHRAQKWFHKMQASRRSFFAANERLEPRCYFSGTHGTTGCLEIQGRSVVLRP